MAVLLIAEHNIKELKPFTLNAVTAASQIDPEVHAVIIGKDCEEGAKALSQLPLVKKVIHVEAAHYENYVAENFAPVIVKLAPSILIEDSFGIIIFFFPIFDIRRPYKLFHRQRYFF